MKNLEPDIEMSKFAATPYGGLRSNFCSAVPSSTSRGQYYFSGEMFVFVFLSVRVQRNAGKEKQNHETELKE